MSKAIVIKHLPATDTKPRRWKVIAEGVPHIVVGAYQNTPLVAAQLLCHEHGWGKDLIHGSLPNGDHVFVFTPRELQPVLNAAATLCDVYTKDIIDVAQEPLMEALSEALDEYHAARKEVAS